MSYNQNPYGQQDPYGQQHPQSLFPSLWGSEEDLARATSACLARVFLRMFAALLVTAAVSFGIYQTPGAIEYLIANPVITIVMMVVQVAVVMVMAFKVMTMSPTASNVMFFAYAILTGVTLSFIFIAYDLGTIFQAFAISAFMFAAMAIYGTITRRDLTGIGSLCFMGLIGIIIASIVNMFWRNETMFMVVNYIGVLVFVGLTAYNTQKIKMMFATVNSGGKDAVAAGNQEDAIRKISVYGALILYLNMINLFLRILAILGGRR